MLKILLVVASLFWYRIAFAYPDFISYGYKSCVTCHFNGMGSGALNDYGRSLFAAEITAADANMTEEQLTAESGFLGTTELPWWYRPGAKFRGMFLKTALEDSKNSQNRFIPMQVSFNQAFLFDQKAEMLVQVSIDYMPTPARLANSTGPKPMSLVAKDYYFRWQLTKGYLLYVGLLDKAYGIRHADHTASNRGMDGFGLNQNDQSHGVILQWNKDKFETFFNLFLGNMNQEESLRQKGLSIMTEYALDKELTVGMSILKSSSKYLDEQRIGIHSRVGFAKGKSILAEIGTRSDKALVVKDEKNGFYSYIQSMIAFARGYNFLSTYQIYRDDMGSSGVVRNRLSIGADMFPFRKTEFRVELINDRTVAIQNSSPDTISAQAQVHVSW